MSLVRRFGDILPVAQLARPGSLSGSLLMCLNIWQLPGMDLWDPTSRWGVHPPSRDRHWGRGQESPARGWLDMLLHGGMASATGAS